MLKGEKLGDLERNQEIRQHLLETTMKVSSSKKKNLFDFEKSTIDVELLL